MTTTDPYDVGPSARDALRTEIRHMPRDELEKIAFLSQWNSRVQKLRAAAQMDVTEEQLTLFQIHTTLAPVVRIKNEEDGEDFVSRDMASFRQHMENEERNLRDLQSKTGRQERKIQRLQQFEDEQPPNFDDQAPIGPYIWAEIRCAFGDGGWREDDPFERAHDTAVAAGGGDQVVRWAHRSCNRAEGVG